MGKLCHPINTIVNPKSTPTIKAVLVEIAQRSQRGAEPAEGLLTEEVGLAGLQQQRSPLEVHVHLTQLLQTPVGTPTHEHGRSHHQVIQTGAANEGRGQIMWKMMEGEDGDTDGDTST